MAILAVLVALGSALCLQAAALGADDSSDAVVAPRYVPTVAVALGSFDERLRLHVDGSDADSFRSQYRTMLLVGLAHPVARWPATGPHPAWREHLWVDGHLSTGVGVTFDTGHWPIPVREDLTLAYGARTWLTLRGGLGLGVTFDASAGHRTFLELGIPLAIALFRNFELVYRPMLVVPLGSETSPVFGGQRDLATRLAFLPFEVLLRFRIPALGW
jgi:hypothetical protein